MLWSQLHRKLGRQPLSYTQHNHVRAKINGEFIELKMVFDEQGHPYLEPETARCKEENQQKMESSQPV